MNAGDPRGLTRRQVEILKLLDAGLRPAEIAEHLCLSLPTVRMHIRDATARLDARGCVAALHAARERGVLP